MTILTDMNHAMDVAGVKIGGPRFFWRIGAAARVALEAELRVAELDVATRDERGDLETVMGFPLIDTSAFDGWELCADEEPTPIKPKRGVRK